MSTSEETEKREKIDISYLLDEFLDVLKRKWWVIVILVLCFSSYAFFHVTTSYTPVYTAEATVSVTAAGSNSSDNKATADQLGKVFPYILNSQILSDIIAEDMGVDYVPGSISVENVEGTNLLTISVSSSNATDAVNVLQSVIKNYPQVAQYVVGQTTLTIVDDSGVPSDTGREVTIRGSVRRAALEGLGIGLLYILIYMFTFRTIRNKKDLNRAVNVPYLGTLPVYKVKKRRKNLGTISILEHNVQQDYLEAIRLVRTRVERKLDSDKKVIMVTSTIPGEGKSTVASNLAISLAGNGKKVILIDCDLRNPSVQSILKIKGDYPGLEKVLNGSVKLSDAFYSFEEKNGLNLLVLCGSKESSEHAEVLSSKKMKELLDVLRDIADVIILDTPPSGMLVDAMMVVRYVDLALYVVMCNYARRNIIMKSIQELSSTGVNFGGVILNGGRESSHGYGYGYYGNYSRYYGRKDSKEEVKPE